MEEEEICIVPKEKNNQNLQLQNDSNYPIRVLVFDSFILTKRRIIVHEE